MQKNRVRNATHLLFDTFHVLLGTKGSSYTGTCCFFTPPCTVLWDSDLRQTIQISPSIISLFLRCCMWFPNLFVSTFCSRDLVAFKKFTIPSTLADSLYREIWLFLKNTLLMKYFIISSYLYIRLNLNYKTFNFKY